MTKNYQSDFGVTDVKSADIRCFQMRAGTGEATVAADSLLGFVPTKASTTRVRSSSTWPKFRMVPT